MDIDLDLLQSEVQHNCDISDATHAGMYSLCGLLLRLRDYFKWERGLSPWMEPEPAELLEWVDQREQRWEEIAGNAFLSITLGAESLDPLEAPAVNDRLRPLGLLYGAGYASGLKPSFFLGELIETRWVDQLEVCIVGRELARDIFVSSAMRQGKQIVARREPMLFFLWDQILEMRPSAKAALSYALRQYGLDVESMRRSPCKFGPSLKPVAENELDAWIHHEVGEAHEGVFTGHRWHEIVGAYANSPVEVFTRVIKDLLADTNDSGLLAHIVRNRLKSSIAFYVSFLRPFTRAVFPEISLAFRRFTTSGDWGEIERAKELGHSWAESRAVALLELHEAGMRHGVDWARARIISDLIEPLGVLGVAKEEARED